MTFVIIEDEYHIRKGLMSLLSSLRKDIKIIGEAENGVEGLKLIQETEPDVIFTDITMPKMDGLIMLEHVEKLGLKPIIIIMTGYAEFDYARKCIRLGVFDYILKPTTITDIERLVGLIFHDTTDVSVAIEDNLSEIVNDMLNTVHESYARKIGLYTFVKKYNMTPEYLSALFSKEKGVAFSQYLKYYRIEEAKKLLLNSDMRIYEIATLVGYPDPQYFSKIFKEMTGVSAKRYILNSEKE